VARGDDVVTGVSAATDDIDAKLPAGTVISTRI
jgi:hypothetical protein